MRAQVALLGLLVVVACADEMPQEKGIPTITPATFDTTVAEHGSNLFVVFFAPW